MFNAGEYWVGDLCYVLSDDDWDEYFQNYANQPNTKHVFSDGREFWYCNTAFGDGTYVDQFDNEYQVDSGTIGVISLADIDEEHPDTWMAGGATLLFEDEFHCSYANGVFYIGEIVIDTGAN